MSEFIIDNHKLYGKFKVILNDEGISKHIINNYIWEEDILNLIVKYTKNNTTFIDIGANIGCHCIGLKKKKPNNNINIIAFEPQPFIYQILKYNMENTCDQYKCYDKGLSNEHKTIYMEMPDYNTCKNPGGIGLNMNGNDCSDTPIEILTLDSYNFENISLIKIDVEGLENQVLMGAYNTIKKCKPTMIIEILGGTPIEKASDNDRNYILHTIYHIETLGYSVKRIAFSDYLCIPNN